MLTEWYDFVSNERFLANKHLWAPALRGGRWYLVDMDTSEVFCKQYYASKPEYMGESLIKVTLSNGNCAIIDYDTGEKILDSFKNIVLCPFNQQAFVVTSHDDKKGLATFDGKILTDCEYDFIVYIEKANCYKVTKDNKVGYIDLEGRKVIPCKYEDITALSLDYAIVQADKKKLGVYSLKARSLICEPMYAAIENFVEDYALVQDFNGNWGAINKDGFEKVPCKYRAMRPFSNGFAAVTRNNTWGYVDFMGIEVTIFIYDSASDVNEEGVAEVSINCGDGTIIPGKIYLQ